MVAHISAPFKVDTSYKYTIATRTFGTEYARGSLPSRQSSSSQTTQAPRIRKFLKLVQDKQQWQEVRRSLSEQYSLSKYQT